MSLSKVLVVGGGIGGMSAAIALRKIGVEVDLIDIDPQWRVYGAGITITGPTLRAFKALGVYDEIVKQAYVGEGIRICDTQGNRLRILPTPMPHEAGVYGSGGIMRPTLHKILSSRVQALGTNVGLGLTVDALVQDDNGVEAHFSDASRGRYDFVVGADGINSCVRGLIFPQAPKPEYTGQSTWRLLTARPPEIDCRHFFLGGPVKVGLTPVSETQMYMFANERTPKILRDEKRLYVDLAVLLEEYGGVLATLRESLTPDSQIVFRPLEAFVLDPPWHVGRVLLIGDSAHPTTPQLASGAGIAVEDGLVLAEEMAKGKPITETMVAFTKRREWRCRLVVDSSIEIGRLEQLRAPAAEQTAIVENALTRLAEPV